MHLGRLGFLLQGAQEVLVRLFVGQALGGALLRGAFAGAGEGVWLEVHGAMVATSVVWVDRFATNTAPAVTKPLPTPIERSRPPATPALPGIIKDI